MYSNCVRDVVEVWKEKRTSATNFCGKRTANSFQWAFKLSCNHVVYRTGFDHGGTYARKNQKRFICEWCEAGEDPQVKTEDMGNFPEVKHERIIVTRED